MINRILIRIKVIQLLYSYLLVEKDFSLEQQPAQPTREKRFAYALYLDLLYLFIEIASKIEKRGGIKPLEDNRFIRNLIADDKLRSLRARYRDGGFQLAPAVESLVEKIKESGLYKNFQKKPEQAGAAGIWPEIFSLIIKPDSVLSSLYAQRENYSVRGVERAYGMIENTFSAYFSSQGHVDDALKQLNESLEKARDLYIGLMLLPVQLTQMRAEQMEENMNKYLPSEEDRNPNMRFVENKWVEMLDALPAFRDEVERRGISWRPQDDDVLRCLLKEIMASDIYADYMSFPATDFATDCNFWRNVYRHIIFVSPEFLEALENKSVFWNDDIDIIGTFVVKNLKKLEDSHGAEGILPMYKDDEDARFGRELFSAAAAHKDEYKALVNSAVNTQSWDTERLAFMDVVISIAAIAELLNFPKIPTVVTLNEYIELAKSYSTSKSGAFVNGLLGSVIRRLREEGKLRKE